MTRLRTDTENWSASTIRYSNDICNDLRGCQGVEIQPNAVPNN